jgi:hypothetical protein
VSKNVSRYFESTLQKIFLAVVNIEKLQELIFGSLVASFLCTAEGLNLEIKKGKVNSSMKSLKMEFGNFSNG